MQEATTVDFGLGYLNLPKGLSARLEYLQMIGEEFVSKLP